MAELLSVGAGGFLGASLRYMANKYIKWAPFPLSTLCVNVLAGLLIGAVIGLDGSKLGLTPRAKLFVNTGILGGLSTFSSFSLETVKLFESGRYAAGTANVALNVILTLSATVAGLSLTRFVFK